MRIEPQSTNVSVFQNAHMTSTRSSATSTSDFQTKLEGAHKASRAQDSVSLSGGSYEQRLENLKKLHAQTDYSGMSDIEKARLINSRFEEAFPDIHAIYGGLYLCAGSNSIYAKISDESGKQAQDVCVKPPYSNEQERVEFVKSTSGYEGLSDEEIRAKINEKYDGGTLADKCGALQELMSMNLDDGVAPSMLDQIKKEMLQGTEGQYGRLHSDHPVRINAMLQYAGSTPINWTQLARATYATASTASYKSGDLSPEEAKNKFLEELEGNLDKFLDHILHTERKD